MICNHVFGVNQYMAFTVGTCPCPGSSPGSEGSQAPASPSPSRRLNTRRVLSQERSGALKGCPVQPSFGYYNKYKQPVLGGPVPADSEVASQDREEEVHRRAHQGGHALEGSDALPPPPSKNHAEVRHWEGYQESKSAAADLMLFVT